MEENFLYNSKDNILRLGIKPFVRDARLLIFSLLNY